MRIGFLGVLLLVICAYGVAGAAADDTSIPDALRTTEAINQELKERREKVSVNCADGEKAVSKCDDFYGELYGKPVVNVVMGFGYGDYGIAPVHGSWAPEVWAAIEDSLTGLCSDSRQFACEFQVDDDASVLTKEIEFHGVKKLIRIRVVQGTAPSGEDQTEHSRKARKDFLEAVQSSDIVMYMGHSRDGGGPDFYPAKRTSGGEIDYAWYRKKRAGISDLNRALDEAEHAPKVIMLLSCLSKQHYLKDLQKHAPKSKYVLTNRVIYTEENPSGAVYSLDALLSSKCASEMKSRSPNFTDFIGFD